MKPWLLIDVDGVLNPNPMHSGSVPLAFEGQGFEIHRIRPDGFYNTFNVGLTPKHGEWLLAMTDVFRLGWATSWEHDANVHIGPKVGLPELPVAEVGNRGYKVGGILDLVVNDPFVWLDDAASEYEKRDLDVLHPSKHLVIDVNPRVGLTQDDLRIARDWALNR